MKKVDMSPSGITGRMLMLDQLWELGVALKTSELGDRVDPLRSPQRPVESPDRDPKDRQRARDGKT